MSRAADQEPGVAGTGPGVRAGGPSTTTVRPTSVVAPAAMVVDSPRS